MSVLLVDAVVTVAVVAGYSGLREKLDMETPEVAIGSVGFSTGPLLSPR